MTVNEEYPLKPCPFCGREDVEYCVFPSGELSIECPSCGDFVFNHVDWNQHSLIEKWNSRPLEEKAFQMGALAYKIKNEDE